MTWDQIKGDWQQLCAKLKEKWNKLTDEDLCAVAGKRERLVGVLQQRYDFDKVRAEFELERFTRRLSS